MRAGMFDAVYPLRVETFPPLILSIRHVETPVVGNACRGATTGGGVRRLHPLPISGLMHRYSEAQSLSSRGRGPGAHYVTMGTDVGRIPGLML